MSFLYVTEAGSVVGINGGYFEVKQKNGLVRKVPKEKMESITVFNGSTVTNQCIAECLQMGVPVNYFSSKGLYFGKLVSTSHVSADRLKKQVYASDDEIFCLEFSKKIIKAKIHNQMVVLRRYIKNSAVDLAECIHNMKISENKINTCKSVDEIMGYEGIAARNYFSGLSALVKDDFKFNGRSRRPPKDPFNSMLSLGYTILMYVIYGEIENRGLSPYISFLHSIREKHPSLASDLMEEWRAVIADSVVMSLVQGKEIDIENFTSEEGKGVYLDKEGMKIFISKFEKKINSENRYITYDGESSSFRRCIYIQTTRLVDAIENKDPSLYKPVMIR